MSPNCGVAVAFVWEDEPQVAQALQDKKVRLEAIHRYELDDADGQTAGVVLDPAVNE